MRQSIWIGAGLAVLAAGCSGAPKAVEGQPQKKLVLKDGRWIAAGVGEPGSAEADLQAARTLLNQGRLKQAERAFKAVARTHKNTRFREDAIYWQAEALLKREHYYKAFLLYEAMLTDYQGSAYTDSVLERYYQIGDKFLSGVKRRLFGIAMFRDPNLGVRVLERIQYRDPNGALAPRALMRVANYYFWTAADYDAAAETYQTVIRLYPKSQWLAQAHILGALSTLYSYRGPNYDAQALVEARKLILASKRRFPKTYNAISDRLVTQGKLAGGLDRYLERIRQQEAHRAFERAEYYKRAGKPASARLYYQLVKDDYADTVWAQEAERCLEQI